MSPAVVAEIGLVVLELTDAIRAGQMEEEAALAMLREQRDAIAARVQRTAERVERVSEERRL